MTPDPTEDDAILTPDELQLDDDRVSRMGENRYVVRSDGSASPGESAAAIDAAGDAPLMDAESAADGVSASADALADVPEPHGVDVTLKTDGEIARHRVASHDVREVFADLLTWYASQLDDDLSPIEALEVLLATTDLED